MNVIFSEFTESLNVKNNIQSINKSVTGTYLPHDDKRTFQKQWNDITEI